jgi:UDP:flavonoid glycosyltransferase YjiC (YdhE family)
MRVLITTTGFPGHLLPVVPVARACARAGHEVCVLAPRSRRPIVAQTGLPSHATADAPGEEVAATVAGAAGLPAPEGHARMIADGFARTATRAALADTLQLAGAWRPDVIVRESQEFAGLLASERHGIPHVRVALGLAAVERETAALAAAPLDALRAELGIPPDPGGERALAAPSLTLVPRTLDEPDGCAPVHRMREDRRAAGALPDWWPDGAEPLVHVTFGSVAGTLGYFPTLYRAAIEALAAVPARVLVTVGDAADPADLGALPANVHAERWVSHAAVAARAAVVVCHGGYGSVIGALAHGVPLVLLPLFGGDQRRTAARVAEVGAGVVLDAAPPTMFAHPGRDVLAALPAAVERVLTEPAHRAAARRLACEIATLPPAARAADVVAAALTPVGD